MKNVLVTGGAGFIGSHLAEKLSLEGYNVVVLDDLSGGFIENVNGNCAFVKGSINNVELVNNLFANYKFTYVFHLAAYATEGLSHFIKRFNYTNNLMGSINLINASVNNGVKCFVFTSSMAVYGTNQVPFDESMIPSPEDSYGIAKYAVEQELAITKELFGMDYVIFRPHSVFGKRQNIGDKYRNVVGIFMNNLLLGKPMRIFGDGEQVRAFTYVSDIIPMIAKAPKTPAAYGKIFNAGGEIPITINRLAELVSEAMEMPLNVIHTEPRYEVKYAFCNHTPAREIFGFEPITTLEDGMKSMAEWVKVHGARQSKTYQGIEIEKNLPSFWRE
jgi:UDP-glucose 4-epimerase